MLKRFMTDETGATAIEYALIGGLFSIVIVASVAAVGDEYVNVYDIIETVMSENSVTNGG